MQPAFLSLLLTAVHMCALVECRPRLHHPEQQPQHQHSSLDRRALADTPAGPGRFYLELSGSVQRSAHRDSLVVLPVKTDKRNLVSIFDLRRKRFLCMDSNGELYVSRHKDREGCLFWRVGLDLENHHETLYSAVGGQLLRLEGVAHREPPEPSSALLQRLLNPLVKRQRRSDEVNPSDPLRSHSHPSHSSKDHKDTAQGQPEQDQAGAVSKETITSCDDPLRVLQSNGQVSPVKTNIADQARQD
ncbi:hypothetical protein INR49_012481 [Caranx melampygus]|nr:hypothetical protein INR49_012481 [Caranx melampygus]